MKECKLNKINIEIYECDYRYLVGLSKDREVSFADILNLYTRKYLEQDDIIASVVDMLVKAQNHHITKEVYPEFEHL